MVHMDILGGKNAADLQSFGWSKGFSMAMAENSSKFGIFLAMCSNSVELCLGVDWNELTPHMYIYFLIYYIVYIYIYILCVCACIYIYIYMHMYFVHACLYVYIYIYN